jgi:hypothetical protein
MNSTHIVGVDPGLVHTGVVRLWFEPRHREITVDHYVVLGPDGKVVNQWVRQEPHPEIFIEGYRPRSNLNSDERMVKGVAAIALATKGKVLNNTGVVKVVKPQLLELIGAWRFSTPTHHQDLRSAARIAVLGMLKNDTHNALLTSVVRDHLRGRTWRVHS